MSKARNLADFISDDEVDTTEIADDAITSAKLDETESYTVAGMTCTGVGTFDSNVVINSTTAGLQIGTSSPYNVSLNNSTYGTILKDNSGTLRLSTNTTGLVTIDNATFNSGYKAGASFDLDGSAKIYYNGIEKFKTISTGIEVTGQVVSEISINTQTGTTYTPVLGDQSKLITLNNSSAITLTIPPNSSVAYPTGTKIDIAQLGAGQVTVAAGSGVTVNSTPTLKLRAQYSAASCIKTATNTWLLVGDLADS